MYIMVKNNTGKKWSVLRDDMGIKEGGIYAITPFDRLNEYNKTVFKVGMADDFVRRIENNYSTYFPNGLCINAILGSPPVRTISSRAVKLKSKNCINNILKKKYLTFWLKMELFRFIQQHE